MAAQNFLPIATDGYVSSNLEDKSKASSYEELGKPIAFNPLVEFASEVWSRPTNLSKLPIIGKGYIRDKAGLEPLTVTPIDFENGCSQESALPDPEIDLECFRQLAYERENDNLAKYADFTIKATPEMITKAIDSGVAFGNIPLMILSQNTEYRLEDAVRAEGLGDLRLVDSLNPQAAYDSLHSEEQRVWNYLEREGLHPSLALGRDGGVRLTVRLFD